MQSCTELQKMPFTLLRHNFSDTEGMEVIQLVWRHQGAHSNLLEV